MNRNATMAAIGLLAAGVWMLWPSITAPTILRVPHSCVSHTGCSAHATCTCAGLEDNRPVVVLDAGDAGLPSSAIPHPSYPDSDLSYGPAGPVDPPRANENCKPHVSHQQTQMKTSRTGTLRQDKRAAQHD